MPKTFTKEDVASHAKGDSLYIVIDEDVYDVSKFQDEHPGKLNASIRLSSLPHNTAPMGVASSLQSHVLTKILNRWEKEYVRIRSRFLNALHINRFIVLQRVAGKDASKQFWKYHNEGILKKYKGQLQIGSLDTKKAAAAPAPAPVPAPKKAETKSQAAATSSSSFPPPASAAPQDPFGDLVPFADPAWYQGVSSCFGSIVIMIRD